jgi:hypothetical protein
MNEGFKQAWRKWNRTRNFVTRESRHLVRRELIKHVKQWSTHQVQTAEVETLQHPETGDERNQFICALLIAGPVAVTQTASSSLRDAMGSKSAYLMSRCSLRRASTCPGFSSVTCQRGRLVGGYARVLFKKKNKLADQLICAYKDGRT